MKRTYATPVLLGLLSLCTTGQMHAGPITPAVEYSSSKTYIGDRPFTLGYQFTTGVPLDVNALAYWVDGLGHDHQVGLWGSAGNLLASTTVQSTDPIQGHFQYHSIPDLLLPPGTYTIGGEFLGNHDPFPALTTGVDTIPGYTWVTDKFVLGSGLHFPTDSSGGLYGQNGILVVDFSIAPTGTLRPHAGRRRPRRHGRVRLAAA